MNNVTVCQASVINQHITDGNTLEASEFMSDSAMPFDQQDRILNAVNQLSKPTAAKISVIIEQAGVNPDAEWLSK